MSVALDPTAHPPPITFAIPGQSAYPACVNARLPPELAQLLEKKVAQGLASAKAGKLVDSEVAIKRLHTRLDKLEKALGAGEPPSPLGPTALSACSS